MKMSDDDESGNSIPFMDDTTTCEEDVKQDHCRDNMNVTEKHYIRNQSDRIKKQSAQSFPLGFTSPTAPLAEIDFANDEPEDEPVFHRGKRIPNRDSVMKLVIKGWNSTVSIQSLDNKSSITLKRKCRRDEREKEIQTTRHEHTREGLDVKKSKKKRWNMLTKSLISKSAKHEKKGLDERYPKYVLLKNEEEEEENTRKNKTEKENIKSRQEMHSKMVVSDDIRNFRGKTKKEPEKSEFHIKRTFKNKTNPLHVTGTFATRSDDKETTTKRKHEENAIDSKNHSGDRTKKWKIMSDRRQIRAKSTETFQRDSHEATACQSMRRSSSHDNVFYEIQGVLKEALELCPSDTAPQQTQPAATCRFFDAMSQPYLCSPHHTVYCRSKPIDMNKETTEIHKTASRAITDTKQEDLKNIQIGIVSTFFPPPVMIMKSYPNEYPEAAEKSGKPKTAEDSSETKSPTLVESLPDLQIKFQTPLIDYVSDKTFDEDEEKMKTDETETTQYLQYEHKKKIVNDESTTTTCTLQTDEETQRESDKPNGNAKNPSLTEIGYKMYDNLTRLSLNCEKEIVEDAEPEPETNGGRNENRIRNSPCNITLKSGDSIIRISIPENKLNFQILNGDSGQPDIQIGLGFQPEAIETATSTMTVNDKKIIRQSDLWHVNGGCARGSEGVHPKQTVVQDCSKVKLAFADHKEVFLSIERRNKSGAQRSENEKLTKEMNVGTDDMDAIGSDAICRQDGESFKNLSPRKSQLLRNLKDKLEKREKMANHSSAAAAATAGAKVKMDKTTRSDVLDDPKLFLVRQISSGSEVPRKSLEVSSPQKISHKDPKIEDVREYYCEDCMATMRIFEDVNPSVKKMVNKFETIIQLERF